MLRGRAKRFAPTGNVIYDVRLLLHNFSETRTRDRLRRHRHQKLFRRPPEILRCVVNIQFGASAGGKSTIARN